MNWSVLLLAGLVTWTLYQGGTNLIVAILAAVMILVSILAHELGHAFQARRDGMETDGITLWLFGGVARFTGNFPSAGAEFRIAAAGPAVSLALAVAFGAALFARPPEVAADGIAYLAWVNAALLLFNLIPALPLDGGRMLRAALWGGTGSFTRGTRIAGAISTVLSGAMIAFGVWMWLGMARFDGIWLAAIGLFLLQSARAENRAMIAQEAFRGLTAEDAMFRLAGVAPARPEMTVAQMLRATSGASNAPGFPVLGGAGEVAGVVPMRAIGDLDRGAWETTSVAEVMVGGPELVTARPGDDLLAVARAIRGGGVAVVSNGVQVVGVVSMREVSGALEARATPSARGGAEGPEAAAGGPRAAG